MTKVCNFPGQNGQEGKADQPCGGRCKPSGEDVCSAIHREKTLYWFLGKLFSDSLPASCSITHKRVDAENFGFLHHSIDLDTLIEQEDLSYNPFVHLNMPGKHIL